MLLSAQVGPEEMIAARKKVTAACLVIFDAMLLMVHLPT